MGYAPLAPGTAGAAVGVAVFLALSALPLLLYVVTLAGFVGLAIWAADAHARRTGIRDDGRIVIDEVAGQLVTLTPLLAEGRPRSWPLLVTGFVLFRVFDVWKPGPVRWLERNLAGGTGIVLDDLLAGVLAAVVLVAIAALWGG